MYKESIWNEVFSNYLEDYPRLLSCWYPERDSQQIWDVYPGKTNFPQNIYDVSGVELEYRYLVPENENYWKFNEQFTGNVLTLIPGLHWIIIAGISLCGAYYYYSMIKEPKRENTPKEDKKND